jgi:NaMN:DMB phosphoribosyltransferase
MENQTAVKCLDDHAVEISQSKVIVFNMLNAAATQLPELHELSDAGAGQNLMHLTPTRDSELIANGHALTPFPVVPKSSALTRNGLLDNGGISPAVLSRGLLNYLAELGYKIEFRSYNFGVTKPLDGQSHWISHCTHLGGVDAVSADLIEQHLLPDLIQQSERGCISLLAECGVGGTTFSTLWLRLLTGLDISPAGSTNDRLKLAKKNLLIRQLEQECRCLQANFNGAQLLTNPRFHDEIQHAIYQLLCQWPDNLSLPHFAGGMMFVAPLLAVMQQRPTLNGSIYTTRWVLNADGRGEALSVLDFLPASWPLSVNQVDFSTSQYSCLQVFEQGAVVEGCGLGGLLVLIEQLTGEDVDHKEKIIAALERACEQHLAQFSPAAIEHTENAYEAV